MTCFHKFGPDGSCEPCDRKDRLDRRNETKDLDRLTADDWRWLDERYERAITETTMTKTALYMRE